jgi:uncharacterized protein (DUF58 family)
MKISFDQLPQLPELSLLAKKLVEGFITGLHKSPFHGFSVEFAEHRLYNTGESTKHIDWKVYARTDRLYTKQYDEETNLRAYLLIDNSSSMYYPTESKAKIKFSVIAAACIAQLLQKQRDAVGLISFSDKIDLFTEVKSTKAHLLNLFNHLQSIYEQKKSLKQTQLSDNIHLIAEKIHKRSLVIVFSDLIASNESLDTFFQSIQHLKHKKHEVLFFQINHQETELSFNLEDRPYLIEDLESGEKIKLNPYEVKEYYQRQAEKYFQEVSLRCQQYKIDLTKVDVNDDIEKVMGAFLIKRSKMR